MWVIGELTPHYYDDDAGGAARGRARRRLTTADDDGSVTIYKFWCLGGSDWTVVADPTEVQGWSCESGRQRFSSNISRKYVSKQENQTVRTYQVRYIKTTKRKTNNRHEKYKPTIAVCSVFFSHGPRERDWTNEGNTTYCCLRVCLLLVSQQGAPQATSSAAALLSLHF